MPHRNVPLGRLFRTRLADLFPRGYPVAQIVQPVVVMNDEQGQQTLYGARDSYVLPRLLYDSGEGAGNVTPVITPPVGKVWRLSEISAMALRNATVAARILDIEWWILYNAAGTMYHQKIGPTLDASEFGSITLDAFSDTNVHNDNGTITTVTGGNFPTLLRGVDGTYERLQIVLNGGEATDRIRFVVWGWEGSWV